MSLDILILGAVLADMLVGDPRWLPHPVRGIGLFARGLEAVTRKVMPPIIAGALTALATIAATGCAAWAATWFTSQWNAPAGAAVAIAIVYSSIAARDLERHSSAVRRALVAGDVPGARRCVGMIVGRDTDQLDELGIIRATVESVAESVVDGVTAPLFYAVVFGSIFGVPGAAAGAFAYRAINTLDSQFGYRNERYRRFGWASARIDDLANFIPARLTAPLVSVAAIVLRERAMGSLRMLIRDGRNHTSPNSGLTEAAMAGALGVQLGGTNHYAGEALAKQTIGDPVETLSSKHIARANALMFVASSLFVALILGTRALVMWTSGRLV